MGINIGKFTKFALIGMATRELYKFGKASIEVASDLREVQNVVDVTFGHMSSQVNEFSSNATKQFGLSELSAKKFTSTMGAMLKSSGLTGQTVTDMSIDLAKLSADMASFYNLENEEAFSKIMSGMSGMTQPLKELGINMNIANLENFAMAQGIKKSWQEMNQAEQTMVRYNYLLNVTADSQGDFAREAGTWANQVKILKEQWKEFMGLIGTALIEILLPIVKGLNKLLEILIAVTKEIGKIYTLITGKKVAVEANNNIANTAMDAADGEEDLADGIGKAAAAAKKAIAPFDELNMLQSNLGNGGGAFSELGGLDFGSAVNTSMTTTKIDEGLKFKIDDEEPKRFFIWFENKMRWLKDTVLIPITVPAPAFAEIPSPIYEPVWNLTPPFVPQPVFPAIEYSNYTFSWESIKTKAAESYAWLQEKQGVFAEKYNLKFSEAFGVAEINFGIHQTNMGVLGASIFATLLANANQGLSAIGINTNSTIITTQNNWQTWGANIGIIAAATSLALSGGLGQGLISSNLNFNSFFNSTLPAMAAWGTGMVTTAANIGRGIRDAIVESLSSAYENFKNFWNATGEKVSGFYNANKKAITTTAIIAGIVVGAGALALAAPAIIPYMAPALGGLAAIPAFANGGVVNSPTLGIFGEYAGARSNPEIVTPQNIMRDTVLDATSTGFIAVVEAVQRLERTLREKNMTAVIGKDDIGKTAIDFINEQTIVNGESPITM